MAAFARPSHFCSPVSFLGQVRLLPAPHARIRLVEMAVMKCDGVKLRLILLGPAEVLAVQVSHVPELERNEPVLRHGEDHGQVLEAEALGLLDQQKYQHECHQVEGREERQAAPVPECRVQLWVQQGQDAGEEEVDCNCDGAALSMFMTC